MFILPFLGFLSSLITSCGASSPPAANCTLYEPITISTTEDFQKIGRDPNFPLNGHYQQERDIDATNLSSVADTNTPFQGSYNGNFYSLKNISTCMFNAVGNESKISNVVLSNSEFNSRNHPSDYSFIACEQSPRATIEADFTNNFDASQSTERFRKVLDNYTTYENVSTTKEDSSIENKSSIVNCSININNENNRTNNLTEKTTTGYANRIVISPAILSTFIIGGAVIIGLAITVICLLAHRYRNNKKIKYHHALP